MRLNGAQPDLHQITALALTNYGHFTSMRVEDGRVRGLSLHLQRLTRDCRHLFDVELDTDRVRHYVRRAVTDGPQPATVRVTVFDPALDLGTLSSDADPHVLVTTRAASQGGTPPLRLRAVPYRRDDPTVKHVGLYAALQRRRAVQRDGFDDALFLDPDGTISEIATSNIGFIRDGRVIWPGAEYLTGITMTLLDRSLGGAAGTEPVTLADLPGMEAAFATNAATGIRAVSSVDEVRWPGEHPMFTELRELYAAVPAEEV